MALKQALALENGITCSQAYARISGVSHNHNELTAHVEWWVDEAARHDGLATVKTASFMLPWEAEVSLAKAYTKLKALPEFADAIDA